MKISKKNLLKSEIPINPRLIAFWGIIQIACLLLISLKRSPLFIQVFEQRVTVWLTLNIAIFAFMEGYSTWMHSIQFNKRIKIEDLRNELEKAYGPLYSLLYCEPMLISSNKLEDKVDNNDWFVLTEENRNKLNNIFSNYPFMFPDEIMNAWIELSGRRTVHTIRDYSEGDIEFFRHIPLKFREMIKKEYNHKRDTYKKLIK